MKKTLLILGIASLFIACNKEDAGQSVNASPEEIVITVDDGSLDADVRTKTTAISSVPSSLYMAGSTGSSSSQSSKWSPKSMSVASGKISTGYYQTASATAYNYYLSNASMAFTSSGFTITADGTAQDVVAGVTMSSSATNPSVTLNHVFARLGSLSCTSSNGYSLSNLSYKLKSKDSTTGTKGTYNIGTGAWSKTTTLSEQTVTSSSDLYLVPGTYTLTVSGTESLGDYSHTFTASTDVTLIGGKVNAIAAKRTGVGAQGITVSVTLASWGSTTLQPTI